MYLFGYTNVLLLCLWVIFEETRGDGRYSPSWLGTFQISLIHSQCFLLEVM